jgi:outer membrane protein OmpA-like peptidoglycan-associated protein
LNREDVRDFDVDLIGRADSRGNAAHNRALGHERAKRVRDILVAYGVDRERLHVKTAGESGALGYTGFYSYGYDRRVDAVISNQTHAPRGRTDRLTSVLGMRQ